MDFNLKNNPFGQFLSDNKMAIAGFGQGLVGAPDLRTGLQAGFQGAYGMRPMDMQRKQLAEQNAAEQLAQQKKAEQTRRYMEFFNQKGYDDLAFAVQNGAEIPDVWKAYTDRYKSEKEVPKPTSDMQEYNFAKSQGFDGSFLDFQTMLKKSGATNVNVNNGAPGIGKLSTDYGYVLDPATGQPKIDPNTGLPQAAPVPGSPAAISAVDKEKAADQKQRTQERYANVVIEDIDRALEKIENNPMMTTGGVGALTQGIPMTPAHDTARLLSTVKSNAGFDRLQQMRDSSPTGGALGQVSNIELGLLQAAIGNLEQSQSAEQLAFNLKRVRAIYDDIINHGRIARGEVDPASLGTQPQGQGTGQTQSGITWSLE